MQSNRSILFQQQKVTLNDVQQSTLSSFSDHGLMPAHFLGRDWFKDFYHNRAFEKLVNKDKLSFDEAFAELDGLDKDQARGVLLGLSHAEAAGLTDSQIDVFLKYGLAKADLLGLGSYQLQALLALKDDGLTSDQLRGQVWLDSYQHTVALLYLIRIKKESVEVAFDQLKNLNSDEASAIAYGIAGDEVRGLESHQIAALIARRESEGLQSREDVVGLDKYQLAIVRRFYHFGLSSQVVRDNISQASDDLENALRRLVLERGVSVEKLIPMIEGLQGFQLAGLAGGLSREDVLGLNKHQINALERNRTIKNGLSADDLRGKDWFDSKKHAEALHYMLSWGEFTVKEAMAEMDGLTGHQAKQVSRGTKRDDIVGLDEFHLKALASLKYSGLSGRHLRGKAWFNSIAHVCVLEHLVKNKRIEVEAAMKQLEGLTSWQVGLIPENISREQILKLTPVQVDIIDNKHQYGFYGSFEELIDANWLDSPKQAELLKAVYGQIHDPRAALKIVKLASDESVVTELLDKIKSGEAGRVQLLAYQQGFATESSANSASSIVSARRSNQRQPKKPNECNMM